jgi:hypothetical protein
MSITKYPLVMFQVEIILVGNKKGNKMFCIGLDDVHEFTELQRSKVGVENYSGYRSQAVNLSEHSIRVIKKGVKYIDK